MKISNLNPFAHLFESKAYPHARTLRGSFFLKVLDALAIIDGANKNDDPNTKIPSLFDYVTLGTFYFLNLLSKPLIQWNRETAWKKTALFIVIPTVIALLLGFIARLLFTIAMAPLALLVCGIVHGVTLLLRKSTYKDALDLQVINSAGEKVKLGELFQKSTNLEAHVLLGTHISGAKKQLVWTEIDNASSTTVLKHLKATQKGDTNPFVAPPQNNDVTSEAWTVSNEQENPNALIGLYKLNMFGAAGEHERVSSQQAGMALG